MSDAVLIQGDGLAACCCASLLLKAGRRLVVDHPQRALSPILMLSSQTQRLAVDVFGNDCFSEQTTPIGQRVVLWGGSNKVVVVPHSGLVISEAKLLQRLWNSLDIQQSDSTSLPAWRIVSDRSAMPPVVQHEFGSRRAFTNAVKLQAKAAPASCWVEAVAGGWLFLVPCGLGLGSLISVGATADSLLAESRLVSDQVASLGESTGSFPAYPRIAVPLCDAGWIACGTAAIAFDPIAGEGAGNALREGILASAVIRALDNPDDEMDLLRHYSSRLFNGFVRHLQECCRFYEGNAGPWWQSELELLRKGLAWASHQHVFNQDRRFRLVDFQLEANIV